MYRAEIKLKGSVYDKVRELGMFKVTNDGIVVCEFDGTGLKWYVEVPEWERDIICGRFEEIQRQWWQNYYGVAGHTDEFDRERLENAKKLGLENLFYESKMRKPSRYEYA